jgi:hypothetical protein
LGRADAHHTCSQRPLRRDTLPATPRAPMGTAHTRSFGGRASGHRSLGRRKKPPQGAVSWSFFLILKDGSRTGPLCAWREGRPVSQRSRRERNTRRPKKRGGQDERGPKLPYGQGGLSPRNGGRHAARLNAPNAFRQTSARSSSVQSGALDALGRRGREADPDSRSASERGGRAKGPRSTANKAGVIWRSTAK